MTVLPGSTPVAVTVRDLPGSLPYSRLFGSHFVLDDDTSPLRRVGRRERELERR